jgi:hypothetical protein
VALFRGNGFRELWVPSRSIFFERPDWDALGTLDRLKPNTSLTE